MVLLLLHSWISPIVPEGKKHLYSSQLEWVCISFGVRDGLEDYPCHSVEYGLEPRDTDIPYICQDAWPILILPFVISIACPQCQIAFQWSPSAFNQQPPSNTVASVSPSHPYSMSTFPKENLID